MRGFLFLQEKEGGLTISRYRAAKLLARESDSIQVTHRRLNALEHNGVLTTKQTRKGTTDYGAVQLFQAQCALALYDLGVTSMPALRSLVRLLKRQRRPVLITLKRYDGAELCVRLPVHRYEREIHAALKEWR